MSDRETIKRAVKQIGNIEFKGLVRKTGVLKKAVGDSPTDVVGFDYLIYESDGTCYSFYSANAPLIGMSAPCPIDYPLGLETFGEYKIDYKKAINIFHSGNWGSEFTSIALSKPLVFPETSEPYWYFQSTLGVQVLIGANTGKVYLPR